MGENKTMQTELQEEAYKSGSMRYIESREVAEIIGKKHTDLLRDIKRYMKQMIEISQEDSKRNFAFSDFFIESSYCVEGQSRTYPCYLVTKKGCEFIAHKLTGIKGTKFTAIYINRFHEMEDALGDGTGQEAIKEMENRVLQFMEQQMKFSQMVCSRLDKLEDQQMEIPELDYIQVSVEEESGTMHRRRKLCQLVNKMAKLCDWDNSYAFHRLYRTIEDVLDISLDEYRNVYQQEMKKNDDASTLEVVTAFDKLYKTAAKLCANTIIENK